MVTMSLFSEQWHFLESPAGTLDSTQLGFKLQEVTLQIVPLQENAAVISSIRSFQNPEAAHRVMCAPLN